MSDVIIALDLGTTSCRAILFGQGGRALGRAQQTYPLNESQVGWIEQDLSTLLQAATAVIRNAVTESGVTPGSVAAISLSTYMHSMIVLDQHDRPLTGLMIWADQRSAPQSKRLKASEAYPQLYGSTGCPAHPMYPLSKLLWLGEQGPQFDLRWARYASIKDLLIQALTGEWLIDHSCASGSGLLNLVQLKWDARALELAGITAAQLPGLCSTTTTLGLSAGGAAATGLFKGTPVVAGAGDGPLSNLGAGAVKPGVAALMIGTSGALRLASTTPQTDPSLRTWCYHLTPECWLLGGAISSGGVLLRWLRDQIGTPGASYGDLTALAAAVPPGSDGLLFLPFVAGERSPYWNALARGTMVGLGLGHTRGHVVRAALEGVAFHLLGVLQQVEAMGGPALSIRGTGGFTQSQLWVEICADVLDRPLSMPQESEGSALGAYGLALLALGEIPNLAAADRLITPGRTQNPNPVNHARYQEMYAIYERTYWAMQQTYADLALFRADRA